MKAIFKYTPLTLVSLFHPFAFLITLVLLMLGGDGRFNMGGY